MLHQDAPLKRIRQLAESNCSDYVRRSPRTVPECAWLYAAVTCSALSGEYFIGSNVNRLTV